MNKVNSVNKVNIMNNQNEHCDQSLSKQTTPRSILKVKTANEETSSQKKKVRFRKINYKPKSKGRKNKVNKVRILYSNVDGIKEKINSIENEAETCEIDIIAIAETKAKPAKLKGFGKWKSKERTEKAGGGVGICARQNLTSKLTKMENIEDQDQDIVWVEMGLKANKKVHFGCYYGKQENDKKEVLNKEYEQLDTQLGQITEKGEAMIMADFNAKLEIKDEKYKQTQSKAGDRLADLIKKHNLVPISLKSTTGKWTWQSRQNNQEKSIIDYVLVTPGLANSITEINVDEAGLHRIKGKTETDHNTIIIELNLNYDEETEIIKRWNTNNKEGWEEYNRELKSKYKKNKPQSQEEMQKLITTTMKNTIGELRIRTGGKKIRETDKIRILRKEKNKAKKEYENAIKINRSLIEVKLDKYAKAQNQLRTEIEKNKKEKISQKLKNYAKEGAAKTIKFWKMKAEAENEKATEPYDTIKEDGTIIKDPEETKNYIAEYYEDLYQARPCKQGYETSTMEIENNIKRIEQELESKPKIQDFTIQDLNEVIGKLKKKKAAGPDKLPNEIFTEADQEVRKIYLENFNNINQTMEIPKEWQEGEIKRLYKGKGVKGKCSNERGITLSSNYGKVYERLINERVIEMVNITDSQAGGKRGSSTVDHLVLAKEIVLSAKMQGKNTDAALLDVTKAYDKAWLKAIMNVLYEQGLTDNHWTIVKNLNENLTAKIATKYGKTRIIKIRDSIRQGGVLSTTAYGGLMDEINKEIEKKDFGIPLYENGEKRCCLLWVDDVLLLTFEGELQEPLNTTDETSSKYHIEFGEPKSNSMPIKNNKKRGEKHKYQIGDMQLKEKDKYKYLGYMQNSKNNNEDHFKAVTGKAEAAFQKMMTLTGDSTFCNIEMETIWTVMEACVTPTITYSGEAWEPSKKNFKTANDIMEALLKRILKTPKNGTPREAVYIETGLMDPEHIILKNRVNMEARIEKGESETMKEILKAKHEMSWIQQNNKIKERMGISEEDMKQSRYSIKELCKKKTRELFQKELENSAENKSKMQYFLEGKKEWSTQKRANYMTKLTRNQASTIFKARTRMIKVKSNYKNGNNDLKCRICKQKEETQQHILEECEPINNKIPKITKEMLFEESSEELKKTAEIIEKRLKMLEDTNIPCYKEGKTKKNKKINQNPTTA